MKVVAILGGLGSQMIKYSIYYSLKSESRDNCYIDTSFFKCNDCWNGFELSKLFYIDDEANDFLSNEDLDSIKLRDKTDYLNRALDKLFKNNKTIYYYMNHYYSFHKGTCCSSLLNRLKLQYIRKKNMLSYIIHPKDTFDKRIFRLKCNLYIDECFINSDNIFASKKERIQELFTFKIPLDEKNNKVATEMSKTNSVAVHVRRTDHLGDNGKLFKRMYYAKAMAHIRKQNNTNLNIFVFSDDINWCKSNPNQLGIIESDKITYVDWNKGADSYKDMQLMTYCKDNIIAISSFSWWGYYLSKRDNKIVCAPKGYWLEVPYHF